MFCVCASFRQGVSSDEDADRPSESKAEGMCEQSVWPCPRGYPSELATRRDLKMLIPEDMSKQQVGEMFKKVVCQVGQLPNLDRLHIFDEPHKKYNPATGQRARHYHIIFRFKSTFANLQICKRLKAVGIHVHFSFNLVGYRGSYSGSPVIIQVPIETFPILGAVTQDKLWEPQLVLAKGILRGFRVQGLRLES